MSVNKVEWAGAMVAGLLLASIGVAGASAAAPTVALSGGVDANADCVTWTDPPTHDGGCVPVVIQFSDEDLSVSATVSDADSVYWYWDYSTDGRDGTIVVAGEGTTLDPSIIPATTLAGHDAPSGWYAYFLTYEATNAQGTTAEYLEVRVLDPSHRPTAHQAIDTAPLPDQTNDQLGHPFVLDGSGSTIPYPALNSEPTYAWADGAVTGGTATFTVDPAGRNHGDDVSVDLRVFSYEFYGGTEYDFPSRILTATYNLDLRPVFTLDLDAERVGDTLAPSNVVVHFPDAADTSFSYDWAISGATVGTGPTLDLTEGGFTAGETITLTVTATNDVEGVSRSVSRDVVVENSPPTLTAVTVGPAAPYAADGLSATTDAHDADGAGTLTYSYQWLRDGTPVTSQTSATLPASATAAGQEWSVQVTVSDGTASAGPVTSDPVTILPDPPVVTITGPPSDAWQSSTSVPVSFTATNGATAECQVGAGAFAPCTSGALTFPGDGVHDVTVRATNAGGTDSATSQVRVDTTAPDATVSLSRTPGPGGWYTAPVTFTVSATDLLSGVDAGDCDADLTYSGPSGTDRSVTMSCTDRAGNRGSETFTFDYDDAPPSASVSVPAWINGDGGNVRFQVSDAGSGVSSFQPQYRIDGGAWQALAGDGDTRAIPTADEGAVIDFRVKVTDAVGHVRGFPADGAPDASTRVDLTAPTAPAGLQVSPRAGGSFLVEWQAPSADGGAPVTSYVLERRPPGGTFQAAGTASGTTHTVSLDGVADGSTHEFRVAALDAAGNQGAFSAAQSAVAHNRAPEGTLTILSSSHADGAALGDEVVFSWTALTPGPGETVTYRYALSADDDVELTNDADATTETGVQFADVAPGTWYFHLAGVGVAGVVEADPLQIEVLAPVSDGDVAAANQEIQVHITEQGEDVLVSWTLPADPPAPVAGVQVWSIDADGTLTLLATLDRDDDAFMGASFAASPAAGFVVTQYYENGQGLFTLDAPPSEGTYLTANAPLGVEEFTDTSGSDSRWLAAVLYGVGAMVLLGALGTGAYFLIRARRAVPG